MPSRRAIKRPTSPGHAVANGPACLLRSSACQGRMDLNFIFLQTVFRYRAMAWRRETCSWSLESKRQRIWFGPYSSAADTAASDFQDRGHIRSIGRTGADADLGWISLNKHDVKILQHANIFHYSTIQAKSQNLIQKCWKIKSCFLFFANGQVWYTVMSINCPAMFSCQVSKVVQRRDSPMKMNQYFKIKRRTFTGPKKTKVLIWGIR